MQPRGTPSSSRFDRELLEYRRSWPVLLAAMAGLGLCVNGLPYYTVGVFIDPLAKEFGWARSAISAWSSIIWAGVLFAGPFAGRLVDRFGVRPVALVAIPVLAASVASMSLLRNNIWMLYGLAILGLGTGAVPYLKAVVGWFTVGRGLALGLLSASLGAITAIAPRLVQMVVDNMGWRVGFLFVGVVVLSAWPITYLFLREPVRTANAASPVEAWGVTRPQAMRMPVFWLLSASFGIFSLLSNAMLVCIIPFLTDSGLSRTDAATYAGLFGVGSFLGRIISGFLFDRLNAAYVCAAGNLLAAGATVILGVYGAHYAFLCIMMVGFSFGSEMDAQTYCAAKYFGLRSYGEIYTVMGVLRALLGGGGAYGITRLQELFGGYSLPFFIFASFGFIAAVLMVQVGRQPVLAESTSGGHLAHMDSKDT